MDNIVIRRLKPADAADVSRISSSITRGYNQTDFRNIIEMQARSEGDASFVAEKGTRLVGYCISLVLPVSFGVEKSAWLALIGVDPDSMGQGIGAKLADEAMKYYKAQGIQDVYTTVRWDATDLVSYFKTLGFGRSDFVMLHKSLK